MSAARLKSQDILLFCKLIVSEKEKKLRQVDLSQSLGINQSEVSTGFDRLTQCHLLDPVSKIPSKRMGYEFLESAVKFFFPAEFEEYTIGIPTSIFAKPLSEVLIEKGVPLVWSSSEGKVQGLGLKPIHESVPYAASLDPKLHELLALLDATRTFKAGRVLEQTQLLIRKIVFGKDHE